MKTLFKHTLKTLGLLLNLAILASLANASALFDGSNANLWLLDENGHISSYSHSGWIEEFSDELYTLVDGQEALINTVPKSSTAMSASLSPVSISGLGTADFVLGNAEGSLPLRILPAGGNYQETIKVEFLVEASRYNNLNNLTLTVWQDDEIKRLIRFNESMPVEDGYFVNSLYLVSDGTTDIRANLSALSGRDTVILDQLSQSYTIASDHPDGEQRDTDSDGLPDVVELALGLDPQNSDWKTDKNNDGWSDFDQWLRSETSDKFEIPVDSDQDGWSDVDEQWRGTNPNDVVSALASDSDDVHLPPEGSDAYKHMLFRFKDRPAANRLYEVERNWTLTQGTEAEGYPVWNGRTSAYSPLGEHLFSTDSLLGDEDIALADVSSDQIVDRLKRDTYKTLLTQSTVSVRLSASKGQIIDIIADQNEKRNHYRAYQPAHKDLTPINFETEEAWTTAQEWKALYIADLQTNLVKETVQTITLADSRLVDAFTTLMRSELALSVEAAIEDTAAIDLQNLGTEQKASIQTLLQRLSVREGRGFSNLFEDLQTLVQSSFYESEVQSIESAFIELDTEIDRSYWIQQQLIAQPALVYWLRFALFDGGGASLVANETLRQRDEDFDLDSLSNLAEVNQTYPNVTLPWLQDSDTDLIADNIDPCPVLKVNTCSNTPQLQLSTSLAVNEVVEGSADQTRQLLVSFQLDRPAEFDVSFDYEVDANASETATAGDDFEQLTGSLLIKAGQQVVTIAIPVYDNEDGEGSETFHVAVSDLQNANSDQANVVIAINEDETTSILLAGQLSQIPIEGLNYSTPTHSGVTESGGRFYYREGETVTFSLGGTTIGSAPGNALVTLFALFDEADFNPDWYDIRAKVSGSTLSNFNGLVNAVTLLQNLDDDADVSNGIRINERVQAAAEAIEIDLMNIVDSSFRIDRSFRSLLLAAIEHEAIPNTWQYKKRWFAMADLYLVADIDWPSQISTRYVNENTPDIETLTVSLYDEWGNSTGSNIIKNDTSTGTEIDTGISQVYVYQYDQYGNRLSSNIVQVADGALVRGTTYAYDRFGAQIYQGQDGDGDGVAESYWNYTFDDYGQATLNERFNVDGDVVYRLQTFSTDGETSVTYRRETDSDGDGPNVPAISVTEYEHDTGRQLFYGQDSNGDGEYETANRYSYESLGHGGYRRTQASDTDNDGVANSITIVEYNLNGDVLLSESDYDADGNAERISSNTYNEHGQLNYSRSYNASNEQLNETVITFNSQGRQTNRQNYVNAVLTGETVHEWDEDGNLLATRTDYNGDGNYNRQEEYGYDDHGNKTTQRADSNGDGIYENSYVFEYNENGRSILFQRFDVDGNMFSETTYSYTDFGHLTSQNVRYIDETGDRLRINEYTFQTGEENELYSDVALTYAAWNSILK